MPSIEWVTPSPLWMDSTHGLAGTPTAFRTPWLVESASDRFLNDFLDLMAGNVPDLRASDLVNRGAAKTGDRLKLFQPFHGRYYLVTGSLVCRQVGLPDRHVAVEDGERTSFVMRRFRTGNPEQAWVTDEGGTGWRDVEGSTVLPGEERLPAHRTPVCKGVEPGPIADGFGLSSCDRRAIFYGYVPVASREKYLAPSAGLLAAVADELKNGREVDPRLEEFDERVIATWRDLNAAGPPQTFPDRASLLIVLDLGDALSRWLPDVYDALGTDGSGLPAATMPAQRNLFDKLGDVEVKFTPSGGAEQTITLAEAIAKVKPYLPLERGFPDISDVYNVEDPVLPNTSFLNPSSGGSTLYGLIEGALAEGGKDIAPPPEVADLLTGEIDTPADGDTYILRLVYERVDCPAIVSAPTPSFTLAKALDPDAPARHVRIELPDLKDLPKFKRGIGMQMSPDLRGVMDRVHKGMLEDEGLQGNDPGWQLGMICSFSIQIVTLVAFVVMFIFLIALNIVFWWLPFLKICFPVPVKKSS